MSLQTIQPKTILYNILNNSNTASIAMDMIMSPSRFIILFAAIFVCVVSPVYSQPQPTTTCTPAMLSGFTPCINFLNGNTRNMITPTTDCCTSVKTLAANGTDCLCQLVTGRSPFQFNINRTLALMLPRACNAPTIQVQCDAANVPIPAPAPGAFAPLVAPEAAPEAEPDKPTVLAPTSATKSPASTASCLKYFSSLNYLLIIFGAIAMMFH